MRIPPGARPATGEEDENISMLHNVAAVEVLKRFATQLNDSTGKKKLFWFVGTLTGIANTAGIGPPPSSLRNKSITMLPFKAGELAADPVVVFWISR